MNIVIISGSPRKGSVTHRVALHLQQRLQQQTTFQADLLSLQDWDVPPMQSLWSNLDVVPEVFKPLARTIFEADAIILVSPEYNGSYAPAMKNLLDHFPKQHHKAMAIVTASPGAMGGMRASQQMQLLIAALFGVLSPYMLITPAVDKKFNEAGELIDPSFEKSIDVFLNEFLWLAKALAPMQEPVLN